MTKPSDSVGLLFSGGIDSAVLLHYLLEAGRSVQPIYVAAKLFWEADELRAAREYLGAIDQQRVNDLVVLDLPLDDLYGDHWSITGRDVPDANSPDEAVYLPGRNPLLIVKARIWCQLHGVEQLALGCLASNPFSDASDEFFESFTAALDQAAKGHVEIVRPLARFSKREVMRLSNHCQLDKTFSCIAPVDGLHCGQCNKCAERRVAFREIEITDPTQYNNTV